MLVTVRKGNNAVDICDFSRSYMTFFHPANTARIQIVARCLVTNERTGVTNDTVLIWPCKSEFMYVEDGLYQIPNYDFCGIWSRDEFLILRTFPVHEPKRIEEWDAGANADRFHNVRIDVAMCSEIVPLTTDSDVVRATLDNRTLVARTHLYSTERNLRAVAEYPITTMNVVDTDSEDENTGRFQVDTGPIIIPAWDDCSAVPQRGERFVEQFDLAFVCYNKLGGHTEFVLREPTATPGGRPCMALLPSCRRRRSTRAVCC